MALDEYKRKRNFAKTPEPSGDEAPKKKSTHKLFFCVQKHLASHLHYDFRLEWNGVLLSWAVPKGPSLNPADKRLAMQTEDHPYDYGRFEGVIPEGYGAGIVMLWDHGTWTPEVEDVDAAIRKGDLKFTLDGFKLKGSWVLVRTGGRYAGRSGQPDRSWLLIKHRDDWAGPIDITTFAPLSVKTPGADFAEILAADNPAIWHSHAPAKGGDTGALFQKIVQRALEMKASKVVPQQASKEAAKEAKQVSKGAKEVEKEAKGAKVARTPARSAKTAKTAKTANTAKSARTAKSVKTSKTARTAKTGAARR
jgi:bifunctional non-homologous end joining protein LigD